MLSDGFVLAVLTSGAFIAVYNKLPLKLRLWIQKHPLATEIIGGLFTYWLHGGTLTAIAASAWVGIFLAGALHVANHPEEFQHFIAAKEFIAEKFAQLNRSLSNWGKQFMAARHAQAITE